MADEEYSKAAEITLDGIPMLEISEVKFAIESGDKPVHTLAKGRAGDSDGPEECSFSFKQAVPAKGREIDMVDLVARHVTKTWGMKMGGRTRKVRGRFASVDETSSVGAINEVSGTFTGKYIKMRTGVT